MLDKPISRTLRASVGRAQSGMVMLFALIILVLMTLGGLMLMRSMDTSNLIAGNMAFQQAAVHSADTGVESAIAWLETQNVVAGTLDSSIPAAGYTASTPVITASQTGETFWNLFAPSGICFLPVVAGACTASPGVADSSGNTVAFVIQRLCSNTGATVGNGCAMLPTAGAAGTNSGNNEGAGEDPLTPVTLSSSVYYRITVRATGPRSTVSFVQSIVAM